MFSGLKKLIESMEKNNIVNPFDLSGSYDIKTLIKLGIDGGEDLAKFLAVFKSENAYRGLCLGLSFMNLERALSEMDSFKNYYEKNAAEVTSRLEGKIKEDYFNPKWLPIAEDGCGNFIGIDLDPGETGVLGQVINFGRDDEELYVLAESFPQFLVLLAQEYAYDRIGVDEVDGDLHYIMWDLDYEAFIPEVSEENVEVDLPQEWESLISTISKPYTLEKMAKVKGLSLLRRGITDLEPLKYFTGCKELILTGVETNDFSPLSSMVSLTKLYLAKTEFNSMEMLQGLKKLKILSFTNGTINQLDGIEALVNLVELSIENVHVPSIEQLKRLKKLKSLDISGSTGYDLSEVYDLIQLEEVMLDNLVFDDYEFLIRFKKLKSISLGTNLSGDYRVFSNLDNLKEITCDYEAFEKISTFATNKIHFTLRGDLSDEEDQAFMDYALGITFGSKVND